MARTLIVANRLPATVRVRDGSARFVPCRGGLAASLRGFHQRTDGLWLGGMDEEPRLTDAQRDRLGSMLDRDRLVPVPVPADPVDGGGESFCDEVLWPLFHYQLDRLPLESRDWDAYRAANARFAEAAAECYQTGDLIWVHDYQLMLVPDLVRQLVPHARIGFFLHTPFPSYEVFRTLPWRRELLAGLLGADLIGFHTFPYVRYFARAVHHILGIESTADRMQVRNREVRVGAFPLGVDASRFEALAGSSRVATELRAIRESAGARRIVLGVDRADDTTGVPRRLLAFERLFERHPSLADEIRLIQAVVPSRTDDQHHRRLRPPLDEMVGRINARFAATGPPAILDIRPPVAIHKLVALYRAADLMLVTALRDGMNLEAKEFVASRIDEDGMLVLSEFTGAADELGEALCINPYDVDGVADRMLEALRMPRDERRVRMRALRQRIHACTSQRWADAFLAALERQPAPAVPGGPIAGAVVSGARAPCQPDRRSRPPARLRRHARSSRQRAGSRVSGCRSSRPPAPRGRLAPGASGQRPAARRPRSLVREPAGLALGGAWRVASAERT